MIEIVRPGPYATVQDLGRPGLAHLGVPHSGAADADSLGLANRLVGNPSGHAGLEVTFGGATLRFADGAWIAITGALCPLRLSGRLIDMYAPVWTSPGDTLVIDAPAAGLRTYVAVRGGIAVDPVLGSRSTCSLSGLGPARLTGGELLPVGPLTGSADISVDSAPGPPFHPEPVLRLRPGPRDDWFTEDALSLLTSCSYMVTTDTNRVGVRLAGALLTRARDGELPSEGMVLGAVQVPPNGQPIIFLADHPPTGGYPVIGVIASRDVGIAAQLRPGDAVRFRRIGLR